MRRSAQAARDTAGLIEESISKSGEGRGKLESVTLRRGGKTWSEPCDYLACGFGFVPQVELAALLGCRMGEAGVEVDEYQRTSIAGVYCAVIAPSATNTVPVTNDDSSEARKSAQFAISRGSPGRPMGWNESMVA